MIMIPFTSTTQKRTNTKREKPKEEGTITRISHKDADENFIILQPVPCNYNTHKKIITILIIKDDHIY